MLEYRENYFKAREIIANELKEKYNLVESYREYNCLTLDSTNYSIHLTFDIPDGDDISITNHKNSYYNDSFMGLVVKKYPDVEKMGKKLKSLFKTADSFKSINEYVYSSLSNKIKFIEDEYPNLFNI